MQPTDSELRDWCQFRRCRRPSDAIYHGLGICSEHDADITELFEQTEGLISIGDILARYAKPAAREVLA